MAIQEYAPFERPQPDSFDLYEHEIKAPLFEHLGRKATEYHVVLNDRYLGELHLDIIDEGNLAVSDGFYPQPNGELAELSDEQWKTLALHLYAQGITKARRVEHPGGHNLFLSGV